ncbi:MAG: NUDIX domain-containing protein [Candidatus Andersenbacteria bacterium]|nr:NUDIX domain-containing protein [bacterium]MDZ4225786.1 NUDIX domain-containing protein [Candidatus Andersenbacteria bacterium]
MKSNKAKYAPRDVWEQILEWAVIPTFDLVIEYGEKGIVMVKRKIAPYKNQWALPGLRMMKGEEINDTLVRIASQEVGLKINPRKRMFLGQYVGKFKTEKQRQDLSTGYMVRIEESQQIKINSEHFSAYKIVKSAPSPMGAMYKFYIKESKPK